MLLTADLLLNYQRCARRAFLDVYGDIDQRDAPNDYVLKLIQDSRENQLTVMADQPYAQPRYPSGDLAAGAKATLELMQQGVERIYQGVLMVEQEDGITLVSIPDVLVKQPGWSYFGDWLYVPTEIKLGKRPKMEYQITLAFHVQVLAAVQGAWVEDAWLLLREKGAYAIDLWEMLPRMQEVLDACIEILKQPQEPEVFIARNRCGLCHWFNHCYSIAKDRRHLSLLPGVTPMRYVQLQALKMTTVEALADANPKQLELLPGFGSDTAHKLVQQAQSVLQNRAFALANLPLSSSAHSVTRSIQSQPPLHALPTSSVELYFDIEAEPTLDLVYLHGVLVVDRLANSQVFYPLVAEQPEDEQQIWQQFLELVWRYPAAPIYHFCPYEAQTVGRLSQLYGTPSHRVQPLLKRFIDLHDLVTKSVTLPVESYALKPIARCLGFDWRDPNANGAQSIYWYAQWLATGDRTYLQSILDYNEDDCRATYHIKDWLVGFLRAAEADDFVNCNSIQS
jgi:predicted RecB family nuclease